MSLSVCTFYFYLDMLRSSEDFEKQKFIPMSADERLTKMDRGGAVDQNTSRECINMEINITNNGQEKHHSFHMQD